MTLNTNGHCSVTPRVLAAATRQVCLTGLPQAQLHPLVASSNPRATAS